MPKPRESTRVLERRAEVAARYIRGESQTAIAKSLKITQSTASKDIAACKAAWLASATRDIAAHIAEQLAVVDRVSHEAWGAWERSKMDGERTLRERSHGQARVSIVTEKHVGDARWIQIILDCVAQRCQILGLQTPKKITVNLDLLSDSQLEALARGESPSVVLSMPAQPPPMAEA